MNNIYTQVVKAALEACGSRAETVAGQAKTLKLHPGCIARARLAIEIKANKRPYQRLFLDRMEVGGFVVLEQYCRRVEGYKFFSRFDQGAQVRASESIGKCGQRSNYGMGSARIHGKAHQARWERIQYKGTWSGKPGQMLYQDYQSCVGISRSGRSVVVIRECKLIRRIIAPSGLLFRWDENGIFLQRQTDKMDYHLESEDWLAKDFATRVRKAMAANFLKRQQARKVEREAKRYSAIYAREIGSTRVTLEDSHRSGNCVEGTLRYAENRLHIPRDVIIHNGYLFSVPASHLLKVNGSPRVEAAVTAAWQRETTVSI